MKAGLTCAHWLLNVQQVCSLTQPKSPISLTKARCVCLNQPSSTRTTTYPQHQIVAGENLQPKLTHPQSLPPIQKNTSTGQGLPYLTKTSRLFPGLPSLKEGIELPLQWQLHGWPRTAYGEPTLPQGDRAQGLWLLCWLNEGWLALGCCGLDAGVASRRWLPVAVAGLSPPSFTGLHCAIGGRKGCCWLSVTTPGGWCVPRQPLWLRPASGEAPSGLSVNNVHATRHLWSLYFLFTKLYFILILNAVWVRDKLILVLLFVFYICCNWQ